MKADSTLVYGRTFLVTDEDGRPARPYDGFYHRDTRHLSEYTLEADRRSIETLDTVSPLPGERVIHAGSALDDGARDLSVTRRQFVVDGLFEEIEVQNISNDVLEETFRFSVGADFQDLFEVRGHLDTLDRSITSAELSDGIRFEYRPSDLDFERSTTVVVHGSDEVVVDVAEDDSEASAAIECSLAPGESTTVTVAITPTGDVPDPVDAFDRSRRTVRERAEEWHASLDVPQLVDPGRQSVVDQSVEDLLSLTVETDYGPVFAAGTPWFATVFGRDSLIAAYQTLDLTARPAEATLRYLAEHQASAVDDFRGAEPGKIMHEIRHGELTERELVPHGPYYGSIDATALFVILLHETWRRTGDDALVEDLWENLERALEWLDEYGDRDDDGFLEYPTDRTDDGALTHQAWKDSGDGILYPDGSHPDGPLAVAEVQGYYYDAKRRAAELYRSVKEDPGRARELSSAARDLQQAFDDAFWLPDEQFYAVALDAAGSPVNSVTTNPGHCLWSGIVPDDRADAVIDRLLSDDMFSGWGVRTLSADHESFNPQSYHLGSVWPHDNSLLALGLARYGRTDAASTVAEALFDAAEARGNDRLPELFAGFDREQSAVPIEYGVACEPQAWAAAAPLCCLRAKDRRTPAVEPPTS